MHTPTHVYNFTLVKWRFFFSSINGKPCPLCPGTNLSHLIKHFFLLGIHSLSSLRYSFPKSYCRVDENCLSLLKQNKPTSFYYTISLKLLIHFLLPFTEKFLNNKTKQNQTSTHTFSFHCFPPWSRNVWLSHLSPHICSFKGLFCLP